MRRSTKYIKDRPEWEFVKVYTDEGISGTSIKKREGFNQMVEDALEGKLDLIITKSVSRFARNTVDSLTTVRKLKDAGVEIFFEKENIWTMDSKGELLITIMSSLAQEESRSISENVTWGQRKRFADGKVSLPYGHFLGYRKGPDGLPEIVPEEAVIIQKIYRLFISGKTCCHIAEQLTKEGIRTPTGKVKWSANTVERILTNEKYKGDALLQKTYTADFLSKKRILNRGEIPQYYVENSHPPIIAPEEFEAVQAEIQRRKSLGRRYSGQSVIAARIVCGDCGDFYGSKVWHSNTKYRRVIWQCNSKFADGKKCETPSIDEELVKQRFLVAFNKAMANRQSLIADVQLMKDTLTDCSSIDAELADLKAELEVVDNLLRQSINQNASTAQNQADYIARYESLVQRHDAAVKKYHALQQKRTDRQNKAILIGQFQAELEAREQPLVEFDDHLWIAAIDIVIAHHDGSLIFKFKNGLEVAA